MIGRSTSCFVGLHGLLPLATSVDIKEREGQRCWMFQIAACRLTSTSSQGLKHMTQDMFGSLTCNQSRGPVAAWMSSLMAVGIIIVLSMMRQTISLILIGLTSGHLSKAKDCKPQMQIIQQGLHSRRRSMFMVEARKSHKSNHAILKEVHRHFQVVGDI